MHRIRPLHRFVIGFVFAFLLLLPIAMLSAQNLIPCSGVDCDLCSFVQLAHNIINFLVYFSTLLATVLFAYSGFLMLTATDNTTSRTKAKELFWTVLWGFAILLAAWLVMDTAMRLLFEDSDLRATEYGRPWNEILCQFQNGAPTVHIAINLIATPTSLPTGGGDVTLSWTTANATTCAAGGGWAGTKPLAGGEVVAITATTAFALSCVDADGGSATVTLIVPVGSITGGSCKELDSGPCAPTLLAVYFPGNQAKASQICSAESGGNASAESGTDRLLLDGYRTFSAGLFQINVVSTVIDNPACGGTLNCPAAFQRTPACEAKIDAGDPDYCRAAFGSIGPKMVSLCMEGSRGPAYGLDPRSYCSVVKPDAVSEKLYSDCVAAAKDPKCNLSLAKDLFTRAGNTWTPWSVSAKKCGLM